MGWVRPPLILKKDKMKIYFVASNDQFIKLIIANLAAMGHDISTSQEFDIQKAGFADVIWCEWADNNALLVQNYITTATKILRVHRYEAYTDVWNQLNPRAFDHVIFVSQHIADEVQSRCKKPFTNYSIIPNYIDINKYSDKGKPENNKIAYAGYVCRKKGIGELLMIAESMPEYEFHIAGTLQEADILHWLTDNKPSNVFLSEWTDNIAEFFHDKNFVINTSLNESFSVVTIKAMLCGCIPIVRDWQGAKDIYPEECLFKSIDDIKSIVSGTDWPDPRQYMIDKFYHRDIIKEINEIITANYKIDTDYPKVTVAVVKTRKKYIGELLNSLKMQDYPIDVIMLDNMDKAKSIGRCFNELADMCKTEWILYVGDDDWLGEDYIESVMKAYMRRKDIYDLQGLLTPTTAFDDTGNFQIIPHYSTGFWKADFVRQYRFDETLVRQVDTEFHKRVQSHSASSLLWVTWVTGYHYRQHTDNISGNKFTEGANTSQEK